LPDSSITPGAAFDPQVTLDVLCQSGYTKTVRHVTESEKAQVFANYGLSGNYDGYCAGSEGCEVDHLIALEIGGSNDISNLWPQSYTGTWNAHMKDRLENRLRVLVCAKSVSMTTAQRAIASDWISAYNKYVDTEKVHSS